MYQMIIADIGNEESPYSKVKRGGWCYLGSHDLTAAAWGEWLPTSTWFTPSLKVYPLNFVLEVSNLGK